MSIDRRNLMVLANFCAAAVDAMSFTLMRTAHSAFVKETEDFTCQVISREGMAFANSRQFGAPWYGGIDYAPLLAMFDSYAEGDICITNDPYSGYVASHSPDIHIWKPVFHKGELVCFVVGHIHNTDVGGAVPASLSRSLSEIEQEGLRLPPVKLYDRGVLNGYVLEVIRTNVRMPEQNIGDLHAQVAAVNIGDAKMREIVERFGRDAFLSGVDQILDYAEAQARRILSDIPDGEYFFADYIDEDSVGGPPCRIALTVRIDGDEAVLDFSGSDPQLKSSMNMPTGGRERHPLVLVGLTYVLYTLDNTLMLNAGTLRAARAILPEGTIVNCTRPAAVGMRSMTCLMTQIVTLGAFVQALPELMPATSPGGNAILNVKTTGRTGRTVMASIGPVGGGGGGTPFNDGSDGAGGLHGFLRNTPLEISESDVPILFRRYGLARDTGGAGRYRGGLSTVMEFEVTTPGTVVTARNRNRSIMSSWGVNGGKEGCLSQFHRNPDGPNAEFLGNTDVVHCDPGDVIRVIGPGAGGFGDPRTRPVDAVLQDLKSGAISPAAAEADYNVLVRNGMIDEAATARLRCGAGEKKGPIIVHGPARQAFEALWTAERYACLTAFLSDVPIEWRYFLKHKVFSAVATQSEPAGIGLQGQMAAIFADLRGTYRF